MLGIWPMFGWEQWVWFARAPWDYLQAANEPTNGIDFVDKGE